MRKCDICHTPIPIGEKICPKCGYKMPDSLKINQEQSQPSPQPKIKKPHIEVKRTNKRTFSSSRLLMVVGIVVFVVLFCLTAIGKVIYLVDRNNSIDSFEEVEDGEFRNFEDLNLYCPTLAKEALPYYKKIKALETSESSFYESYRIEDNAIENFSIGVCFEDEAHRLNLDVYNYSGKVWHYSVRLKLYDYQEKTLKIDDFKIIADYLEIDLDTFFNQCSTLYEGLFKDEEFYGELDYGLYQIYISRTDGIEFSIYKV